VEEGTVIALLAAIAGLVVKEFFAWLRSRNGKGKSNPGGEGSKLDRVISRLDVLIDHADREKKSLAAISDTVDTMARRVARFEESQLRIERIHGERLKQERADE
jgi:hypothetical protein